MDIGMLWYDDDARRPIGEKVTRAVEHYKTKYGVVPTVCFVNPATLKDGPDSAGGVQLRSARNVLVNHAQHRKRIKRGGGAPHLPLHDVDDLPAMEADRILALDAALEHLAMVNPRHVRIVECRFFAGMTIEETAYALGISPATAKRDWTLMRAWLSRELEG